MKKIALGYKFFMIYIVLFICSNTYLHAQTWELKWSDEFDYTGLPDNTKWGYDVGGSGWGNNELQYYTSFRSENSRVESGNLIIEARKEVYGGKNYTSARLITNNTGDWKYGRIEVKAKLPGGKGSWPAIWMLPTDWVYGSWPKSGEVDIMEYVGYDPGIIHGSIHTDAYNWVNNTQKTSSRTVADAETAFHVYSIDWYPNKMEFFVDGTLYFTFINGGTWQKWPFDQRFHLLLNIAVGGNWGGAQGVDDNIFPIKMEVDYVRVYQDITLSGLNLVDLNPVELYPNPVKDIVTISSAYNFNQIDIYSLSGQKVKSYLVMNDKLAELNLGVLKEGVYSLVIKKNNGEVIGHHKLVKSK